jgi:threonine synthase
MMGLPISRLVLATNENDVLDEFFRTGVHRVRSRADTFETSSPSMDISKASNLERFVFDLLGRNASRTKSLFEDQLRECGSFNLSSDPSFATAAMRFGFRSGRSTNADRLATIRDTWDRYNIMIDPHTADGVTVGRIHASPETPMIVLETAQPIKFAATIKEALGRQPVRPRRFEGLEGLPRRVKVLPPDAQILKSYIADAVQGATC